MLDQFIPTANYQKALSLVKELSERTLGLEMAMIVARAGRGKTTVLRRIAAINVEVVYVSYAGWLSHAGILREVAFAVAGARPRSTQVCLELLERTLSESRRVIVVDEADRMGLRHLNILRDLHDRCATPIVLVGEESLKGKLAQERRLISRTSLELVFQPVAPSDVALFYRKNLSLETSPQIASTLAKHSQGDFRLAVKDALRIERAMRSSGITEITEELVTEVCR